MSRRVMVMVMLFCVLMVDVRGQYNTSTSGNGEFSPGEASDAEPPSFDDDVEPSVPSFDDDVQSVPIDGGLGLLLAAGVGYAANRMRKRKQNLRKASGE